MSLQSLMNTTITLQVKATTNAKGGQVPAWTDVSGATCVPAAVQPGSGNARKYFDTNRINVTHTAYVASDIGARKDMRMIHPDTGRIFKVQWYVPPAIGFGYEEWPGELYVEEELLP